MAESISDLFINRLIRYYNTHGAGHCLPIWDGPYAPLRQSLSSGDVEQIRTKLESIYIDDLWGLDYNQINSWHLKPYDECFSNCLKVITSELNIDNDSRENAIERIEKVSELDIDIPEFPHRPTIQVGARKIPLRFLVCHYLFYCMRKNLTSVPKVGLEIGAGTGYIAYLFTKFYPTSKYYIVDLPIISIIQSYIYATMVGEDKIWFHGESKSDANLLIYSPESISEVTEKIDVAINHNSFPEIPQSVQAFYLDIMRKLFTSDAFFYSVNWEPNGIDQTPTIRACDSNKFERLHRRHFVLEGKVHEQETEYFEEIYKPKYD